MLGLTLAAGLGAVAACAGPEGADEPTIGQPAAEPPPSAAPATPTAPEAAAPEAAAPGAPAVMIDHGPRSAPKVALTFHGSGDPSITRHVMNILTAHSAHATVFAVGTWLAAHPEVARLVLDAGNEFGNHTWSHPELSTESPERIYSQIVRCRDELTKVTGSPGAFFRQSDGQYPTREELKQAGRAGYRRLLAYDVDSTDWLGADTAHIRRAVAKAGPGSVISLHLGRPNTVAALPSVLADLAGRKLAAVSASQLLAQPIPR